LPTPTYTALATVTLGSSAASVTFSSIPATYRDLRLIIAGTTSGGVNTALRFNSDSGSNYFGVFMLGNGSTTASGSFGGASTFAYFGALWTTQGNTYADIMDYSATDKHKTLISRYSNAANEAGAMASRWANTAAITTVQVITTSAATYAAGTTFSLYGVIA
jgi:hypothetical protein